MVSIVGGMHWILKNKGSTIEYIHQAIKTGVYCTQDELKKVWKEHRDSTNDLQSLFSGPILSPKSIGTSQISPYWMSVPI
jgi:hypothetical protein